MVSLFGNLFESDSGKSPDPEFLCDNVEGKNIFATEVVFPESGLKLWEIDTLAVTDV